MQYVECCFYLYICVEIKQLQTMPDDRIVQLISESLRNGEKENISFQITGEEALDLLRRVYECGRAEGSRQAEENKNAEKGEEYLSYAEVKKLLKKSDSTLWLWNKKGLLEKTFCGGRVLYRREDVERIFSSKK